MTTSTVLTSTRGGRVRRSTRTCSVEGCERQHEAKGLCVGHYQRRIRGREVDGQLAVHGGQAGERNGRWAGGGGGYLGAHRTVYRLRGAAAEKVCEHCGVQAEHWAYDHSDPAAKSGIDGPYSTDPSRYMALCASCHKKFDLTHAGRS